MATLRGSTAGAFTSNARNLVLPVGTVAGDYAVLFAYDGFGAPVLSGISDWTSSIFVTGFGDGILAFKLLTSADITTGSVTITWNGNYGGHAALSTVLSDQPPRLVKSVSANNGDTGTGRTVQVSLAKNTDVGLYWAFKRKDGVTPMVSLSRGTSVDASGVLNVAGAYSTEIFAAGLASFPLTSTVDSGGNVDGVVGALMSDSPVAGAIIEDTAATTYTFTGGLYKGRATATADAGSSA